MELFFAGLWVLLFGGRPRRTVPARRQASKCRYSFWYTRGGQGGRGRTLEKFNVRFSLHMTLKELVHQRQNPKLSFTFRMLNGRKRMTWRSLLRP